jgi:hypothetical protein
VDPGDFTKWNVLNAPSLPLPAQDYVADNFRALSSAHAGLLLCFLSPEVEAAFPEQAQALYAGFQELYEHPATVEDVLSYQSVTPNAYNEGNLCRGKVEKGNLRQGKVENRQVFVLEQPRLSLPNQ